MANELQFLQSQSLLAAIHTALRITDMQGKEIYHNANWDALLPQMEGVDSGELAAKALECGSAQERRGILILHCIAVRQPDFSGVVSEIYPANLDELVQGSPFDSADISARLNRLQLRDCIANSASMIRVFEKAKQVANYPTTVLLVGETGAGKEVVASFIHRNSRREDKAFIKINCSAIPEQLLESELFGYETGAFTGAKLKGKPGLFELANNGTLLLDEIGDMALPLQAKLLRVLQENEIMRLGGQKAIPLNVRIISSTNRNIKEMMEKGQFSEALYYRLNVVELYIPPLRERREDILPLCTFFLSQFCEKYKLEKTFSQEVKEYFARYDWPGNVRELCNMVENTIVSSDCSVIGLEDIPQRIISARPSHTPAAADVSSMQDAVEGIQKEVIRSALEKNGSLRKAAKALEMDPATLHRLAKKLGIPTT